MKHYSAFNHFYNHNSPANFRNYFIQAERYQELRNRCEAFLETMIDFCGYEITDPERRKLLYALEFLGTDKTLFGSGIEIKKLKKELDPGNYHIETKLLLTYNTFIKFVQRLGVTNLDVFFRGGIVKCKSCDDFYPCVDGQDSCPDCGNSLPRPVEKKFSEIGEIEVCDDDFIPNSYMTSAIVTFDVFGETRLQEVSAGCLQLYNRKIPYFGKLRRIAFTEALMEHFKIYGIELYIDIY